MRVRSGIALFTLAAIVGFGGAASASTITFATAAGATNSGGNLVDASAQFVTGSNSVTITMDNLLTYSQVVDVAQNISQLFFTLSTGQTAGSISSITGTSESVSASGVGGSGTGVTTSQWGLTSPSAGEMEICVLCTQGNKDYTLIGGGAIGNYPNANGSIDGNGPHNPFLVGPVTFVLNVPGVTADSTISSAIFGFGTAAGNNVDGSCTTCTPPPPPPAVPEPGTFVMLGSGLAVLVKRLRA